MGKQLNNKMEMLPPKEMTFLPAPKQALVQNKGFNKKKTIYTNLYKLKMDKTPSFYTYVIKYEPEIEADWATLKREVFSSVDFKELDKIYSTLIYTGDNLFSM